MQLLVQLLFQMSPMVFRISEACLQLRRWDQENRLTTQRSNQGNPKSESTVLTRRAHILMGEDDIEELMRELMDDKGSPLRVCKLNALQVDVNAFRGY